MRSLEQAIAKLRRPPSVPNWVRYNHPRTDDSARDMARFALNGPRHSLQQVYPLMVDMATMQTPLADALQGLEAIKSALVRRLGREILIAFNAYNSERKFDGILTLDEFSAYYPLGRNVFVPVKPTFVIIESGKLVPVFAIGWTSMPFDDFQKRLLSTIIHNAVLTLTGFIGSDAEIISFPRALYCKSQREVRAWKVSQYPPFSNDELAAHLVRYGKALELAAETIQTVLEG